VATFREEHFLNLGFSQCWSAEDFVDAVCDAGACRDVMGFHKSTINSIVRWYHGFLKSFELQYLGLGGEARGEERGTSVGCRVRVEEEFMSKKMGRGEERRRGR
jgi:hypothetical protein